MLRSKVEYPPSFFIHRPATCPLPGAASRFIHLPISSPIVLPSIDPPNISSLPRNRPHTMGLPSRTASRVLSSVKVSTWYDIRGFLRCLQLNLAIESEACRRWHANSCPQIPRNEHRQRSSMECQTPLCYTFGANPQGSRDAN